MDAEEIRDLERDIEFERQLPYTLIVEKVEGDEIYTHNQWGNEIIYLKNENGSFSIKEE